AERTTAFMASGLRVNDPAGDRAPRSKRQTPLRSNGASLTPDVSPSPDAIFPIHLVLIALNKPYGVLSQFTPEPGSRWRTLAEFQLPPDVYPLGRLDADSEGLLLLS